MSTWVIVTGFMAPVLLDKTGSSGTFFFFAGWSLLGLIYEIIFIKETTFRIENEQVIKLTEKEKKELYSLE